MTNENSNEKIALMEQAKSKNLIVCLPTGSGKTYIAILLIKELAHQIRDTTSKRTVILVKTSNVSISRINDVIQWRYCR